MEQKRGFEPEIILDHTQRSEVANTVLTPGYQHINRIMRAEVDKVIIDLINVDEDDDALVLAKHKLSKAAAQFFQRVVNRINHEVEVYRSTIAEVGEPVDMTEGIIDLGEHTRPGDLQLDSALLEEESL